MAASGAWVGTIGAGGGNWEGARAELLRPGFRAGGEVMGVDLSTEGTAGLGAGAVAGMASFLPVSTCTGLLGLAVLTGAGALMVLTGGTTLADGLAAGAGAGLLAFAVAITGDLAAEVLPAGLAGAAFDTFGTGIGPAAAFLTPSAAFGADFGVFAVAPAFTGVDTALALTAGLAAACACTLDFLAFFALVFTGCLLSEAA